ncbi:hypothetical protein R84B8_02609 [Treponema sp. R8-4-B8]
MIRYLSFLSALFILATSVCFEAWSQPVGSGMMPEFRRQALVLDINARALENEEVIWTDSHQKITIPGTPVGIRLVGSNIIVAVQFTPFIRRNGNVMVAQGQIWINDPEKGVSYYTSIQTIPMEFNEPIYFFPLGASPQSNSSIEIKLTVNPYKETSTAENDK